MELGGPTFRKRVITVVVATLGWFAFWVFGLPGNYFADYPVSTQIGLSVFAFFIIIAVAYLLLVCVWKDDPITASLWLAFYASVPLIIYDYMYLGVYRNMGHAYLVIHWYLTAVAIRIFTKERHPGAGARANMEES